MLLRITVMLTVLTLSRSMSLTRVRTMMSSSASASSNHFDYLIIGGGSGGMASARRAATFGAKVAVIEKTELGGTCVNVGCVPKKVMFNAATINEHIHDAKHFGFNVQESSLDWKKLKLYRDNYVKRLNGIYNRMLSNNKIQIINGLGSFNGDNKVIVDNIEYTADNILIAVGGKPNLPSIPGIEYCISSDGFFKLEDQPKSVAVIGGGYIGVEMGGIFQALGTKTTIITRADKPLRGFDNMIVDQLLSEFKKQKIEFIPNKNPISVKKNNDGTLTLTMDSNEVMGPFDQVLFATGRVPLLDSLNLKSTNVKLDKKGKIIVDEFQATNAKGVYAVGDVCSSVELTPTAIAGGRRLADRLFNKMANAKADYSNVPTVVFSHPPIGTCGFTEEDAKAKYGAENIKVYTSTFTNLWYGTYDIEPDDKPKTAMKLVTLLPTERVIGLHSIGMGSDELLQGFGVALKMGATKADFDSCVAIHPTAAEEFVTMAPWGMSGISK